MPVSLHHVLPVQTLKTGLATELDSDILFKNDFRSSAGITRVPVAEFITNRTMKRPLVAIDLAPVSFTTRAPGTARLVAENAKALAGLDVGWDWLPTVEGPENQLKDVFTGQRPLIVGGKSFALRTWFSLGRAWAKAGCQFGFATTCFVPFSGPPCLGNLLDSNIYEHGDTWIQSGQRKSYWVNRFASDHSIRRAKKLLVLSNYCRDYLARRFPGAKEKFVSIPCGLTPLPAEAPQPAWATGLNRPYFVYVATFSENKNQRRLLEAWARLQQEHADLPSLVLAGPCPEDYRQMVIDPALKALPRHNEVLLPGRLNNAELAWVYSHALGALQPSIAEGFGMPVIEAMSQGAPVACSDTTSLPETAGGAALLFSPFKVEDICRAVVELWKDEALRQKLSSLGRERSAVFTWRNSAEKIASEIEQQLKLIKAS